MTRFACRTLRTGAWVLAAALAAVGVVTAQFVVLALASFAALACGLAGLLVTRGLDDMDARHAPVAVPVMTGAVGGLSAVLVIAGLAVVVGAAAVPIVAVALALVLWRRLGPSGHADTPLADTPLAGVVPSLAELRDTLAALSDDELARAWRRSHTRLTQAGDSVELGRVSALRRWQLDELERRDPVGFRTWVGSGTWVTGDSAPFLGR